jgi:Na+/H+ antiporter NhaC
MEYGILSLAPAFIALVLAFITRDATLSLLIGVLVGIVVAGQNLLFGFSSLLQNALGNADFIWVLGIEVFIGIMVAFFSKIWCN